LPAFSRYIPDFKDRFLFPTWEVLIDILYQDCFLTLPAIHPAFGYRLNGFPSYSSFVFCLNLAFYQSGRLIFCRVVPAYLPGCIWVTRQRNRAATGQIHGCFCNCSSVAGVLSGLQFGG
jgi:hypothetical protein